MKEMKWVKADASWLNQLGGGHHPRIEYTNGLFTSCGPAAAVCLLVGWLIFRSPPRWRRGGRREAASHGEQKEEQQQEQQKEEKEEQKQHQLLQQEREGGIMEGADAEFSAALTRLLLSIRTSPHAKIFVQKYDVVLLLARLLELQRPQQAQEQQLGKDDTPKRLSLPRTPHTAAATPTPKKLDGLRRYPSTENKDEKETLELPTQKEEEDDKENREDNVDSEADDVLGRFRTVYSEGAEEGGHEREGNAGWAGEGGERAKQLLPQNVSAATTTLPAASKPSKTAKTDQVVKAAAALLGEGSAVATSIGLSTKVRLSPRRGTKKVIRRTSGAPMLAATKKPSKEADEDTAQSGMDELWQC